MATIRAFFLNCRFPRRTNRPNWGDLKQRNNHPTPPTSISAFVVLLCMKRKNFRGSTQGKVFKYQHSTVFFFLFYRFVFKNLFIFFYIQYSSDHMRYIYRFYKLLDRKFIKKKKRQKKLPYFDSFFCFSILKFSNRRLQRK